MKQARRSCHNILNVFFLILICDLNGGTARFELDLYPLPKSLIFRGEGLFKLGLRDVIFSALWSIPTGCHILGFTYSNQVKLL